MRRCFVWLWGLSLFLVALQSHAQLQKFHLVPERSKLEFVGHGSAAVFFGFNVTGQFKKWSVEATLVDLTTEKVEVKVQVDTASLSTENEGRDKHLRGADFFNADAHPKALFVLTKLKKGQENTRVVSGTLTFRGVSKDVEFPLAFKSEEIKGKISYHIKGTLKLDRKDFGMTYQSTFPVPKVKDNVEVNVDLWLEPNAE